MVYAAAQDPLCYEASSVLINRAGLENQDELNEFEFAMYLTRAEEPLPRGSLDYAHYRAIHRHLFQDVYDWAGEQRTIRIGKGGNWFCYPEHLTAQVGDLFDRLAAQDFFTDMGKPEFAMAAAKFLADLNACHPFREGNGRTQLALLKVLVLNAGHNFDDVRLDPQRTLSAMIESFSGSVEPLRHVVLGIILDE